jgi:integrase
MNFREYSTRWTDQILSLKKPATQATIQSHIRFLNLKFGEREIGTICNSEVQALLSGLSTQMSARTVKNIWGTLRNILGRARRDGLVATLPEPDLPQIPRQKQPWFEPEALRAIIDKAPDGPDKVLCWLLSETGMRIGEALGLTADKINVRNRTITVEKSVYRGRMQETKTANSDRVLCISTKFKGILTDHLGQRQKGFVFQTRNHTPEWPAEVARRLTPVVEAANQTWGGFHAFRRANATIMSVIGVPEKIAAVRLGHAASGLSFGLYAQAVSEADREWAEKIGASLAPKDQTSLKEQAVQVLIQLEYGKRESQAKVEETLIRCPHIESLDDFVREALR